MITVELIVNIAVLTLGVFGIALALYALYRSRQTRKEIDQIKKEYFKK
jgi:hypothetical protein